jgi:hypothetical protein
VTAEPRAFLAIDHGSATTSVGLVGRVGPAWRWLGGTAVPAAADSAVAVDLLVARLLAADPDLAAALGWSGDRAPDDLPRLEVRSRRPARLAVVAGSERALAALRSTADRSGWRTVGASVEAVDPLAMTALLLDPTVEGVLAGAGDPPRPDERSTIAELAALVAAVAARRPTLPIILAGGMSEGQAAFGDIATRPGDFLLAPAAVRDPDGGGDPLATFLLELALPPDDPRRAVGAATQTLADVLDRHVETIVLGHDASVRASSVPSAGGVTAPTRLAVVPTAAVAPEEPDDALVDGVLVWSTVPSDRHRLRDRLRELRIAPWSDVAGEGAALRMAAARAALGRLVEHTSEPWWSTAPDLVVTAGGVWSSVPAPTVTLALIDVIRRTGASQYALDHGRLLGVLGAIPDPAERRLVIADLADDLLAPLGSVVTPAGLRAGRSAGSLVVHAAGTATELDLVPGGLELVDLAPGETAVAEFKFRDTVRLATRGRHFAVDVGGGLAGLLVDLRDVPLRLPDRADRRRDLLAAWQAGLWAGADS